MMRLGTRLRPSALIAPYAREAPPTKGPVLRSGRRRTNAVADLRRALGLPRAVSTAVEAALDLDAVAHDLAAAVLAHGRQPMNCAFEAIEDVMLPSGHDFEGLVVLVSAYLALTHGEPPRQRVSVPQGSYPVDRLGKPPVGSTEGLRGYPERRFS